MASAARSAMSTVILLLAATVIAQTSTTTASTPSFTAVSGCHVHDTQQWCMVGTDEYQVVGPENTEDYESQYTGCHLHGTAKYCFTSKGDEVEVLLDTVIHGETETETEEETHDHETTETETEEEDHDHETTETATGEQTCHFHAGVEHCVDANGITVESGCEKNDREYNVPLRIGLLFAILVTGGLGVFTPILATSFTSMSLNSIVFVILKQFGTGVVLSTAFIHLFTHAQLMFANKCIGALAYESTAAAVFSAGLILSFLVDYLAARFIAWRHTQTDKHAQTDTETENSTPPSDELKNALPVIAHTPHGDAHPHMHPGTDETVSVMALEAGMIFHSILIGLTLVVAGDSFFITLFIVILFHQVFEGIALGTCIAGLSSPRVSLTKKLLMAAAFAVTTPIGMGIGIGVLKQFNGNSASTLVAMGTLDAFSAGILAWVGIVEMWVRDWIYGDLARAGVWRTVIGMAAGATGFLLMSVLGKWT